MTGWWLAKAVAIPTPSIVFASFLLLPSLAEFASEPPTVKSSTGEVHRAPLKVMY